MLSFLVIIVILELISTGLLCSHCCCRCWSISQFINFEDALDKRNKDSCVILMHSGR